MLHKEIADQWTRNISEIARYNNSIYIFSFLILLQIASEHSDIRNLEIAHNALFETASRKNLSLLFCVIKVYKMFTYYKNKMFIYCFL